ncbi:Caleosin related protein-domain-containing protein [Fusarium solani]|uniref:Caleosin related protein-domain-containing protein n=1 Tax=Fusarium solani TaxID=169388 RepID=A0A9P9HAZ2_FUSSL|nr:Caleosin related protein-domain-containing protein [Fusarium solani]KAH7254404.1 Caleosin related protein-domain-containing protein [Fusarium solani]
MDSEQQTKSNSKSPRGPDAAPDGITTSIDTVPITLQRKPYQPGGENPKLAHAGVARANLAATHERPGGTTEGDWAHKHRHQTDHDGVIYPIDTFRGFHQLGFGVFLSLLSVFIIHANFSYPTLSSYIPDPWFRVYIDNIHKDKHGSDTGVYDTEGRFIPQKFEDIFSKYAEGRDYLTLWDVSKLTKGQRLIADPIGWFGAFFEWLATYIMLWPKDGRMMKEDIRMIYDGSLFYVIAARRRGKQ